MITREIVKHLSDRVRRNLPDLFVGFVICAPPAVFLAYVIFSGSGEPVRSSSAGQLPRLGMTSTPSATEAPSPGVTSVQRIKVPGPDRTVLTYQTSVAPGETRLVRETISVAGPGITSRSIETLPGQVVTVAVTADASTVMVPGPGTTVTVTETAPGETVTVPGPETVVTVTEEASADETEE